MNAYIESHKKVVLALLFLLSIFLILFRFTDTPKVWVDEGVFTETAKNLALHGEVGLQTDPGVFFSMRNLLLTTSYPVIFPVALSLKMFGLGVFQARLPMVVYMFTLVVLFYLFAKRKYGLYPAVASVLLLLSFAPFYGNGRAVQGEVPGIVFLVLGAYVLLLWEEKFFNNRKLALFSGVSFGLACAVKPIFLVCVLPTLVIWGVVWFKKVQNKKDLFFFVLGLTLPLLVWLYIHFPTIDSLLKLIPTFLYFGGNHSTSVSTSETLIQNFLRFFTESTPILFTLLFATSLLYLVYPIIKRKVYSLSISEYILFSFVLLNSTAYLFGTGWYRYFFPAHLVLYLLFPQALLFVSGWFNKPILKKVVLVVPIFLILFQFYFLIFKSDVSFTINRTRNKELASVLSKIDPSKKVLFYNAPETIIFLKGNNYSQYFYMDTFLVAGDPSVLSKPTWDFMLTDRSQSDNLALSCYKETKLSQYYFLEKTVKCKK